MSESYSIVDQAKGEPLAAGRVGVRVKVRLSGSPSARWSQSLSGHLVNELTGHAAVGHLRLNNIVQGDHIVLDGVEAREAPQLGPGSGGRSTQPTTAARERMRGNRSARTYRTPRRRPSRIKY